MNLNTIKNSKNLKNSIWSVLEVLLGPFILFVSIPIFLDQLGPEGYGIWMFVNSVVIVMQALNLGLNFSTYKHVSASVVDQSYEQIHETLNTNLSLTGLIAVFSFLVCGVLCLGIHQYGWFIESIEDKSTLIICLFLGMIVLFSKLTEQILYNVFRAFEQFKYVTIISISVKVCLVLGNILLAFFTQRIVLILVFTALVSLLGNFVSYGVMKRFVPGYRYRFKLDKYLIRNEVKYSMFIWIQSIAVIAAYQGDRLLVSSVFGLAVLSYYAIVSTIFNHVHMAFAATTSWLFPQMVKKKGDKEAVKEMYLNARNVLTVLAVLLMALFSLLSEPVFSFWLGNDHFQELRAYLKWFSMFEFFFIFTIIPNYFLNAVGEERFNLRMVMLFTSSNVIGMLAAILVNESVEAMLIGLFLSTILAMVMYHAFIERRFFEFRANWGYLSLLFIPSFFGCGIAYFDDYLLKGVSFILCLTALYVVFVKIHRTNFKMLLQ